MKPFRLAQACLASVCLLAIPATSFAQTADQALRQEIDQLKADLETLRKQYEDRLSALEVRLAEAKEPPASAVPAPAPDTSAAAPALQASAAAAGSSKVFNPDISVLGNFAGAAGKNPFSEEPSLSLTEVETAFQAVVDPYARADFFLSAGPEGLEVEEGYITFTALPAGVLLKAGKMRAQFGKVNTMHTHILPWVDRPLVSRNLFGGDEGVADSGLSVSKLIPNGFMFVDAIGEVYRGDSDVFRGELTLGPELPRPASRLPRPDRGHQPRSRRDRTRSGRARRCRISTRSASASTPRSAIVRCDAPSTVSSSAARRSCGAGRSSPAGGQENASGFYASGDYQFARRWFVGARGDRSGRALDSDLHDSGVAST